MNSIKQLMESKNIGFNELQEGTKISKSTLSPLVNSNEIPNKTKLETLERISVFLGVSIITLLENDIKSFVNLQFIKEKSDLDNRIICYSYENKELFFELEIQNYEINKKLEYYLLFVLHSHPEISKKKILSILENSSYNDISIFLELSLNRLKIKLKRLNSSIIPIELQISFENGTTISAQRMSMYSAEHSFFNLPRKEGNSFNTKREIYEL